MIRMARIRDIAEQIRGVSYSKDEASISPTAGHLPILRAGNITDDGLIFKDLVYVPCRRVSANQRLRRHDVVIAASSGSLDVVGKAAAVLQEFDGSFGAFCKVLRPGADIEPRYFAHFFKTVQYRRHVSTVAAGININNLRGEHLDDLQMPLPSLRDQRRIADILDRADTLRAKRRAALNQLRLLPQSIFVDMFGDPTLNPQGLPKGKLTSLGTLDRGVSKHRPRNAPQLLGGTHPLIQTGDIANCDGYIRTHTSCYSDLGLKQSKIWPAGTLCITIAANIAKTGILTFDACFPDSVVGFSAKSPATVEFIRIWFAFVQKHLEDDAPQSAQKNINLAVLRNLEVPIPSLDAQIEFARRVKAVENLKTTARLSLTELDDLFASLQHRAFRGEL